MLQINGGEIPAEAYLQRQARHRHVIDIYDVIDADEYYVYVMERPEVCKDLFDIIHDRDFMGQPLTEREVRRYFAQILQANINCEETGVLHRDIKPENILVDMRTDEAKLIDFGLASEVQQEPFTHFRGENNPRMCCMQHLQVQSTLVIADTFGTSFCVRNTGSHFQSNLFIWGSEFCP